MLMISSGHKVKNQSVLYNISYITKRALGVVGSNLMHYILMMNYYF